MIFIFNIGNRIFNMIIFTIFNSILFFTESLSFIYDPKSYFSTESIFNWLDVFITIGLMNLVIMDWVYENDSFFMNFHFFGILFICFRFLLELRIF